MNALDRAIDRELAKDRRNEAPFPPSIPEIEARAVANSAELRRQREAWEQETAQARRIVEDALGGDHA